MLFWGIAGFLTLLCVITLIWPILRDKEAQGSSRDFNLRVYKDQLSALESDFESGRLNRLELETIRIEIQRRILKENELVPEVNAEKISQKPSYILVTLMVAFLVPAVALGIYANLGTPELADASLSERTEKNVQQQASLPPSTPNPSSEEQHSGIDDMVTNLKNKLTTNPDNLANWQLLGRTLLIQKRYEEAAKTLRNAVPIFPDSAGVRGTFAEALVLAAGGRVSIEALKHFKILEKMEPKDPRVRYYLGLADYQQNKVRDAIKKWLALRTDTPDNAPWGNMLEERIRQAVKEGNISVSELEEITKLTEKPGNTNSSLTNKANSFSITKQRFSGPNSNDIRAARSMSKEDRQAMINTMVEGLAEKLEDSPNDIEGWLRLSRSYGVLGKPKKSIEAIRRAAELAPNTVDIQMAYARLLFPEGTSEKDMPEEFKSIIKRVLEIAPGMPEALYFRGLIAKVEGDITTARNNWTFLLNKMEANAPARSVVKEQIRKLR